jgi:hypothetical protein
MSGNTSSDQAPGQLFFQIWGQPWLKVIDRVKAPIDKVEAIAEWKHPCAQIRAQLQGDQTVRRVWHSVGGQARDQHDD